MNTIRHTPGPWQRDNDGFISCKGVIIADPQCSHDIDISEREANASLIAAAPDHALLCRCLCKGIARWELFHWDTTCGEICCNGLRYSTELDEFGVPKLSVLCRNALIKAEGGAK